jgi:hypothetical protein
LHRCFSLSLPKRKTQSRIFRIYFFHHFCTSELTMNRDIDCWSQKSCYSYSYSTFVTS